ncbi:MAG: ABC transporter permease [Coriobacteriia bacterium]|nr:ABC transporter permease [Coriobacteriia bacterium]
MRRVFAIAGLNLTQLFRDRSELIGTLALPLLLTWVFGSAFGSGSAARLVVPVADMDRSIYAEAIVSAVEEPEGFTVEKVTPAEAYRRVREGDAPVAIVIERGFGEDVEHNRGAKVETVRDPGSTEAQAVVELVTGAGNRIAADAKAARVTATVLANGNGGIYPSNAPDFRDLYAEADRFWDPDPPVGIVTTTMSASKTRASELNANANTQYSLGFTVFFVLMVSLSGAGGIVEERELGTLRRLLATPSSRGQIIGGKVLGVASIGAFEAAVLVGFGALLFGVPWGNSPLAVTLTLGALVLAATGLGIMLSALVKTRSQLSALVPVVSTAMAMVGGCYWPVEITPPFMQKTALLLPTGQAMVALKNTVSRGMGIEAVIVPVAALLVMATVFFVVGLSRLKLE